MKLKDVVAISQLFQIYEDTEKFTRVKLEAKLVQKSIIQTTNSDDLQQKLFYPSPRDRHCAYPSLSTLGLDLIKASIQYRSSVQTKKPVVQYHIFRCGSF